MSSELWKKINYITDADFIVGSNIYEFDIEKCNIHILYNCGIIDRNTFEYLYNAPKSIRVITVGNLQKKFGVTKALQSGIIEVKRIFFDTLNLEDNDIISIRNDAVFFIDIKNKVQMDEIHIPLENITVNFRKKGTYTSFYSIKPSRTSKKLEIMYNSGRFMPESFSVAGITDEILPLHENYFVDFLKALFQVAEYRGALESLNLLKSFYINYINLNLDIGYYRRFDSLSRYDLVNTFSGSYQADMLDNNSKYSGLDISYNESILRNLIKIFATMYLSKR